MKTKRPPARLHLYAGDGIPDHNNLDRCTVCKLPKSRCPNKLPSTTDDARRVTARILGESED